MNIETAISRVDTLKPNGYGEEIKIAWLSQLDWQIKKEIIDKSINEVEYNGYDSDTDRTTELLVPEPYDEIYLHYLKAQIDFENNEISKFNNNMNMFNALFDTYAKHYRRNNYPKSNSNFKYYGGL